MKVALYLAVAVLALAAVPAFGQEMAMNPQTVGSVANLEQGFPVAAIDTTVTETGRWVFGVAGGYVTDGEAYETALVQVNYGIIENVQAYVKWPFIVGEGEIDGNFDTTVEVMAKLVEETDMIPSMAIEVLGRIPTGIGFTDYDGTIRGVATKTWGEVRTHLNVAYTTIGNEAAAARNDQDSFAVAADYPVTDSVVVVGDYFNNESYYEGGDRVQMVEGGVRAALTDIDTVSFGLGLGVGNGNMTPDFTATVGYQRLF